MDEPFTMTPPAAPEQTPLQRFLDGADDVDLGELRREIGDVITMGQALRVAYDECANMLARWAEQAGRLHEGLFGGWHPDPFVRGAMHGEGYAWLRAHTVLVTAWNALRMREVAGVKRGE